MSKEKLTPREIARINRLMRRQLSTKAGMADWMNSLYGPGGWHYDPDEELWIAPDDKHTGPGRGFICVRLGGNWFKAVIPDRSLA